MADDLELAASLVREAGLLAADMLRAGLTTRRKTSISDVVSAADHAAEELIVARLRAERPGDGLIGEEGASHPGGRTWFIDPVDGTYNFLSGLPIWCAALALVDSDGLVLGAVYQPATDELWLGGREQPTTRNGVPVPSLTDRPLADVSVVSYLHPTTLPDDNARIPLLRAIQGAATVRMLGSGSVELAAIAGGRLGASVQLNSLDWDWLPGRALVEAAGGAAEVIDAYGHRWHVAGSRQAVDEICALILDAAPHGGLSEQVTTLVTEAGTRLGCRPRLTLEGPVDELDGELRESLLAVLSEALANLLRHAYAGTIDVSLSVSAGSAGSVALTVRDDGVGPNDEPTSGTGLRDMAARAEALGGTFAIEPNEPLGTAVTWRVPLP